MGGGGGVCQGPLDPPPFPEVWAGCPWSQGPCPSASHWPALCPDAEMGPALSLWCLLPDSALAPPGGGHVPFPAIGPRPLGSGRFMTGGRGWELAPWGSGRRLSGPSPGHHLPLWLWGAGILHCSPRARLPQAARCAGSWSLLRPRLQLQVEMMDQLHSWGLRGLRLCPWHLGPPRAVPWRLALHHLRLPFALAQSPACAPHVTVTVLWGRLGVTHAATGRGQHGRLPAPRGPGHGSPGGGAQAAPAGASGGT